MKEGQKDQKFTNKDCTKIMYSDKTERKGSGQQATCWKHFQGVFYYTGGAASSSATNVNTKDWKLLLERIQGFLNVKHCQN